MSSKVAVAVGLLALALAGRAPAQECPGRATQRNLYWGDLHVHSVHSFDAYTWDVRGTPDEAYAFAQGEELALAPLDAEGRGTRRIRLERALDFAAVTDHAELLGEVSICSDPEADGYDGASCRYYRAETGAALWAARVSTSALGRRLVAPLLGWWRGPAARRAFSDPGVAASLRITAWLPVKSVAEPRRLPDVCGDDGERCRAGAGAVWARTRAAAEQANRPCEFSALLAYEYSGAPQGSNLHRNVVFRGARAPALPTSYVEAPSPPQLWRALERDCLQVEGCDALAIPHNPNRSNGRMFTPDYGDASERAQQAVVARLRQRLEPLVEIMQHKGDSECRNGMAGVLGPADELCAFEKYREIGRRGTDDEAQVSESLEAGKASTADCGDETGSGGFAGCGSRLDYVRYALVEGLSEAGRIGVNPLKLGIIASTDAHNANPGDVEEDGFDGHFGSMDAGSRQRLSSDRPPGGIQSNPGGLVAVWAPQNTREALFDALARREVYGTSGPRMSVRLFAGWGLPANICARPDRVAVADAGGVPMGSDLARRPQSAGAPRFAVWATRDPGTESRPGTDLERIQIIKGWLGPEGHIQQELHDVVVTPRPSADIDLEHCVAPAGSEQLCGVWEDPGFDPERRAVYYARVVERPTCRYSWHECRRLAPGDRPESCERSSIPRTIRERAWTSPIWYSRTENRP